MTEKQCFKCKKIKDLSQFYKHKQMTDGHLNKCKVCTKKDAKDRYDDPESKKRIIEYEKKRFKDPKRKRKVKIYFLRMRKKNPGKYKARTAVSNAVRDGRLKKQPCEVCGEKKSEAHHDDYRKKLDVRWFCRKHHLEYEGKSAFLG